MGKKRVNLYLSDNTRANLEAVARDRELIAKTGARPGEPNMSAAVTVLAEEAAKRSSEASTEQS